MTPDAFQTLIERDVIEASGPDVVAFLQGQLSQDVAGLALGASAYSLLLQPQGKIDAWLRVTRTADDGYLLDVEGGWADAVVARLNRFKLRTKCELTVLEGWTCWAVRGTGPTTSADVVEIAVDCQWPGVEGYDRLGPGLAPRPDLPVVDTIRYGTARVAAGVPAMGAELDEHTIPAEAGAWLIDRSVSFTKGCYTGQELVARIDSRGSNTPRKLRLVRAVSAGPGVTPGAPLLLGEDEVGVVTSVAAPGEDGSVLALAFVKRAVDVPAAVAVGDVAASVEALPEA